MALRDKRVRKVVEEILKDQKHRDRFRAIEFVAKYAGEAETILTGEQVMELARQLGEVVVRHVPELERREAIQAELQALGSDCSKDPRT